MFYKRGYNQIHLDKNPDENIMTINGVAHVGGSVKTA